MKQYARWCFVNPRTWAFLETVPLGPNLVGMTAGLSLHRALLWADKQDAETYREDIQAANPAFKLAKVVIEIEEDV